MIKEQCDAIYTGTTVAHGGECLLPNGHDGWHKTYPIAWCATGMDHIEMSDGFYWESQ